MFNYTHVILNLLGLISVLLLFAAFKVTRQLDFFHV